jgi:hypothetical protein
MAYGELAAQDAQVLAPFTSSGGSIFSFPGFPSETERRDACFAIVGDDDQFKRLLVAVARSTVIDFMLWDDGSPYGSIGHEKWLKFVQNVKDNLLTMTSLREFCVCVPQKEKQWLPASTLFQPYQAIADLVSMVGQEVNGDERVHLSSLTVFQTCRRVIDQEGFLCLGKNLRNGGGLGLSSFTLHNHGEPMAGKDADDAKLIQEFMSEVLAPGSWIGEVVISGEPANPAAWAAMGSGNTIPKRYLELKVLQHR